MKIIHARLFVAALMALASMPTSLVSTAAVTAQTSCETLSSLSLPSATITSTQFVPAGKSTLIPGRVVNLPAFCRVAARLNPATYSDIRIEVWLPTSTWNGRFQAVDSAGGSINYAGGTDAVQIPGSTDPESGMIRALRGGFATAGGTVATAAGPSGFPEVRAADVAYRAVHEMTLKAKAIIEHFYGKTPMFSYFNGCSAGGGQGVMEAHRFPEDYDGIIAGAPGSPLSYGYAAGKLWLASATLKDPSSAIPPNMYPIIHEAVLRACDTSDGLSDGVIDDPRRCNFNPEDLVCKGTNRAACLTVPQVQTVKRLFSPVINPRTGALIYPPVELGSELNWTAVAAFAGQEPPYANQFRNLWLTNQSWNWRAMDLDQDVTVANKVIEAQKTHALEPDLRSFADRGGKLLLYQGWSDVSNAPQSTINYYSAVQKTIGEVATSSSVRLFMAPGMGHCGYGEGPNTFDGVGALVQWVEGAKAPDRIVASHGLPTNATSADVNINYTRPWCPYPQVARYNGTGSIDDAANFACTLP